MMRSSKEPRKHMSPSLDRLQVHRSGELQTARRSSRSYLADMVQQSTRRPSWYYIYTADLVSWPPICRNRQLPTFTKSSASVGGRVRSQLINPLCRSGTRPGRVVARDLKGRTRKLAFDIDVASLLESREELPRHSRSPPTPEKLSTGPSAFVALVVVVLPVQESVIINPGFALDFRNKRPQEQLARSLSNHRATIPQIEAVQERNLRQPPTSRPSTSRWGAGASPKRGRKRRPGASRINSRAS